MKSSYNLLSNNQLKLCPIVHTVCYPIREFVQKKQISILNKSSNYIYPEIEKYLRNIRLTRKVSCEPIYNSKHN